MSWKIDDVRNALADHGIEAIAAMNDEMFYRSKQKSVDPSDINNTCAYAFYAYCSGGQIPALAITSSLSQSQNYTEQAERKFIELAKTLVKNTTGYSLSDGFSPHDGYEEEIGEFKLYVERDTKQRNNSLRAVLCKTDNIDSVKQFIATHIDI